MRTYDGWEELLARAAAHAARWADGLPGRRVVPAVRPEDLTALGGPLPEAPEAPADVLERLAAGAEPGLTATGSGRFFGFVIGGALPAALAADVLGVAWDQNTGLRAASPAHAAVEDCVERWVVDVLGLPRQTVLGLVPGGQSANFTCLAAARDAVLRRAGHDVGTDGLTGAPRVHVLVGAERHETVDRALRFLGLGAPTPVAVDGQGRVVPAALADALSEVPEGAPLVVCLQAGHIHSGAYDPFPELVPLARERDGWVHVDGAIGLWSAAAPRLRHLTTGMAEADSWSTDAHKTLNAPYDCGMALVREPAAVAAAMGMQAAYMVMNAEHVLEPIERTPEWSRRGRAFGTWAALRSLGRSGLAALVEGLHDNAVRVADGLRTIPGVSVLNDVVSTQVTAALHDDETTRATVARVLADGRVWISGSRWHDRDVMRVSVANWSTDADDVDLAVEVVREAVADLRPPRPASPAAPS
ncbi:pyridoxal phosphate-dependent decarboxylase family protein [Aquipuribacter nitratireducens]|uniref:Pyridoxal phosphate-dependent decarboxylase family protein n=1 Tax=Aquipuribacter nitratireducens TaxID=650104 RepID=A0ABW0GI29_9MICO